MDIIVLANKDINSIRSPILKGAIAAMIRADKKAKALQKETLAKMVVKNQ